MADDQNFEKIDKTLRNPGKLSERKLQALLTQKWLWGPGTLFEGLLLTQKLQLMP